MLLAAPSRIISLYGENTMDVTFLLCLTPATGICKQLGTLSVSLFRNNSELMLGNLELFCFLAFSLQEVSTRYRQNPFKLVKSNPCTYI